MENNDSQVIPITDIRRKYKLSGSELKEKLIEQKLDLLVRRPENVDIYASGSAITPGSNEPKTIKDYYKKNKGTPFSDEHDFYNKLSENVIFLTISVAEWFELNNFGKVLVNKFQSIYFQPTEGTLTKKTAQQIIRNIQSPLASLVIDSGIFLSSRSGPLSAMDILLAESDIYISRHNAEKLLKERSTESPKSNTNQIKKEYWMSEKLLDLNTASKLFISELDQDVSRDKLLSTIEDWLRTRWGTSGARLIEQAALAIIPDELYWAAPKKPDSKMSGDHRSSALIIINETAKSIEDKFSETGKKRDKATTIQKELIDNHSFTKNLAIAATSIIILKKRTTSS